MSGATGLARRVTERTRHVRHAGWLVLAVALGCRSQVQGVAPADDCRPSAGRLQTGASAAGLAGDYRLVLVATRGPAEGQRSVGTLYLEVPDDMPRPATIGGAVDSSVVHAARGAADIDLGSVGAVTAGSTSSRDPERPGVLVIESRVGDTGPRITLRLGAEANRSDVVRFDGAYTALHVREIADDGFAGEWSSGAGLPRASGQFCATRATR